MADFGIQQAIVTDYTECDWCGGTPDGVLHPDEQYFITPDQRCMCETCVEQNDWVLTSETGLMLWQYTQAIKLYWQTGKI